MLKCYAKKTEKDSLPRVSMCCLWSFELSRRLVFCNLYSYPSAVTTYCEPCNIACSLCNDPTNSLTSCTACATLFIGNPTSGVICASCFSGCASCLSTSSFSCTSCTYQYFYYSLNNSCLSSCPLGFYG